MRHGAKTYHRVAVKPETPPTSPPSNSPSQFTRPLLDGGAFMRDDTGPSRRQQPRTSPYRRALDKDATFPSCGRESDPYKHSGLEGSQQADVPFIAELPASVPLQPLSASPPTQTPMTPPSEEPAVLARRPVGGTKQTTYLNPAGEPWVNVPPPSAPLPAPPVQKKKTTAVPTPSTGPNRSAPRNRRIDSDSQSAFSPFPQFPEVPRTARSPSQQQQHTLSPGRGQLQGQAPPERKPVSPPLSSSVFLLPPSPPQDHPRWQAQQQQQQHPVADDQERQRGLQRNFSLPTLATLVVPDSVPNVSPATSESRSAGGASAGTGTITNTNGSGSGSSTEAPSTKGVVLQPQPTQPPPPPRSQGEPTPAHDSGKKPRSDRLWYGPDLNPESGRRKPAVQRKSPALQQAVFW
ncbi:hypothetical protein VTH82DRAFT_1968 [Thermothelomyces myriococcoides]